ncbi:hypothetical protein [Achromobacter xylosoxidans]|uniref:hypothetical protein n=1 Tax=Alcaligenes xylosoxydans xylosoxydans TaxID=85698 RepID=UPI0012A88B33|nr:hypothetical protein [Achromobacter xylosoxidans]CUR82568.1 hypothetical protein BN2910_59050 [Achromobacter xylosoxidans]
MFPNTARQFVNDLLFETEAGRISWQFDPERGSVETTNTPYKAEVEYWFNPNEELGMFFFRYTPEGSAHHLNFSATQGENDYHLAQRLFDSAQASTIEFPTIRPRY